MMSPSIPQNGDRVVQGFPVSANDSYVVYGFPADAQSRNPTRTAVAFDRAAPSTAPETPRWGSFMDCDSTEYSSDDDPIFYRRCGGCVGTCISSILAFMLLFLFFFVNYTSSQNAIFQVESASIFISNGTRVANQTMASWKFGILTRNPNSATGFRYDEIDVVVSHNTEYIFSTKIVGFNSRRKSETLLDAAQVVPLSNINAAVVRPSNRTLIVDVNLQGEVFVKEIGSNSLKSAINVLCKDVTIELSNNGTHEGAMAEGPKRCLVGMKAA